MIDYDKSGVAIAEMLPVWAGLNDGYCIASHKLNPDAPYVVVWNEKFDGEWIRPGYAVSQMYIETAVRNLLRAENIPLFSVTKLSTNRWEASLHLEYDEDSDFSFLRRDGVSPAQALLSLYLSWKRGDKA